MNVLQDLVAMVSKAKRIVIETATFVKRLVGIVFGAAKEIMETVEETSEAVDEILNTDLSSFVKNSLAVVKPIMANVENVILDNVRIALDLFDLFFEKATYLLNTVDAMVAN